jgi:hypothetical protein
MELIRITQSYVSQLIVDYEKQGEALRAAEQRAKTAECALESLTLGGSEFVGEPERCVAVVRELRSGEHEALVKAVKDRDTLTAQLAECRAEREAAESLAAGWIKAYQRQSAERDDYRAYCDNNKCDSHTGMVRQEWTDLMRRIEARREKEAEK